MNGDSDFLSSIVPCMSVVEFGLLHILERGLYVSPVGFGAVPGCNVWFGLAVLYLKRERRGVATVCRVR